MDDGRKKIERPVFQIWTLLCLRMKFSFQLKELKCFRSSSSEVLNCVKFAVFREDLKIDIYVYPFPYYVQAIEITQSWESLLIAMGKSTGPCLKGDTSQVNPRYHPVVGITLALHPLAIDVWWFLLEPPIIWGISPPSISLIMSKEKAGRLPLSNPSDRTIQMICPQPWIRIKPQ